MLTSNFLALPPLPEEGPMSRPLLSGLIPRTALRRTATGTAAARTAVLAAALAAGLGLRDSVYRVLAAPGVSQVDLVGHSQGGMLPQYYVKFLGGAATVHELVALSPDSHGTTLDGLDTLAATFPWFTDLVSPA